MRMLCSMNPESAKIQYGLKQLNKVLGDAGSICETDYLSADGRCWVGVGFDPELLRLLYRERATAQADGLGREGYALQKTRHGGETCLTVTAEDSQGLLYGLLELAEQIETFGYDQVQPKIETAYVPFRGAKCNLPWEPYQEGYSTDLNQDVYWDLAVWERYLDRLARGRTNVLILWSQHPYHLMVKIPKYPEACPYSDAEMAGKTRFWKRLFAMAKERGMAVYLQTWNIHIHEHWAKIKGFPVYGYDHPEIRDYLREAVKETIAVYEDLTGFATNPGERMYDFSAGKFEDFILDVYIRALKEAKRQVPFLLRSNWLPAEQTRAIVKKAAYGGPIYIDWKFNTSHGLSTWKLSGRENNQFLQPEPDGYRMLWHVRNEEAYILQWGDPEYVRNHAVHNHDPRFSEGYFFGPERVLPFLEETRLDGLGRRLQTYDFDRRWYMYEMWGRMGYNPDTPNDYWHERLGRHYKLPHGGAALYKALRAASQVALEFNTFWAGTWDGTAYAEGNLGFPPAVDAWDGVRERRFISVTDFIFHACLDRDYMTIPEYAAGVMSNGDSRSFVQKVPGRVTPFDVAARLAACESKLAGYLGSDEAEKGESRGTEWAWMLEDLAIWGMLAGYYRHKIQASAYLYGYMRGGHPALQEKACEELELAYERWRSIADYTRPRIARQGYDHFNVFHWDRYLEDARGDIALARSVQPFERLVHEIRCYVMGVQPSDGWGSGLDREDEPERTFADGEPTEETVPKRGEADRIEQYLTESYRIGDRAYRWRHLPELSPSLDVLMGRDPLPVIPELGKRYDIRMNLKEQFGEESGTAYFAAVLNADRDEAALFEIKTMDFVKIWINGKRVFQSPKTTWYTDGRRGGSFAAPLKRGENLLVIKTDATRRPLPPSTVIDRLDPPDWGFYLHRGSQPHEFHRHHIFPHTIKGLTR